MIVGALIKVELKDGTICQMAPKALDLLLKHEEVSKFKRSDGWAVVGRDSLRATKSKTSYGGSERRLAA